MLKHKLSIAQALALLTALGAPVAEIVTDEKDASGDYDQNSAIQAVDDSRTTIIKPKIQDAITEEVKAAVAGKSAGTVRTILARLTGIKRADLEGLNEEEAVQKALEHYNANSSKSTEELRKQLTDVSAAHAKALEDKDSEWGKKLKDAEDKYTERDIDAALTALVNKVPRSGGDATKQALLWKSALREKYHIHYDSTKNAIELRKKDNPEAPALNEAGTQVVNTADLATGFLKDMGIAVGDMRHKDPNDTLKGEGLPRNGAAQNDANLSDTERQAKNLMAAFDEAVGE